jgi:ribosome-binding protein aMBF1 (putative translation factor)
LWTVRLLQHREKTQELVTSEEINGRDKQVLGNKMGERLAQARKDCGLSQEELEKKSGLSQSKISRIESGSKILSTEDARVLAPALKVTMKFLISGKE